VTTASDVVRDRDGVRGKVEDVAADAAVVRITLEDGTRLQVPRTLLVPQDDGSAVFSHSFAGLIARPRLAAGAEIVVPVVAETLHVDTHLREVGRVRVHKQVHERVEIVDVPLLRQDVVVERVAVGRVVDVAPAIRHEGDVMIVPILEEVLVVEKRLVLREELHIRHETRDYRDPQGFVLRSEEITVERSEVPPNTTPGENP